MSRGKGKPTLRRILVPALVRPCLGKPPREHGRSRLGVQRSADSKLFLGVKVNILDDHLAIHGFQHVVEGEGGNGDGGERLHLHPSAGVDTNFGTYLDAIGSWDKLEMNGVDG